MQPPAENGHRQPGVVCIERDKGVERFQLNVQWQRRIRKGDMGEGVRAGEARFCQARQAGKIAVTQTAPGDEGREQPALKHPGVGLAAGRLRPQGKKCEGKARAEGRPVEDLPVTQRARPAPLYPCRFRPGERRSAATRRRKRYVAYGCQ